MRLHQPIYLLFLFNLFFLAALTRDDASAWVSAFALFSLLALLAFKKSAQKPRNKKRRTSKKTQAPKKRRPRKN